MRISVEDKPEKLELYKHVKPVSTFGPLRCFTRFPGKRYSCTLAQYHEGPHVAHGFFKRVIAVWDEEERTK